MGPYRPSGADWPGCGAPPGAFPPPSTFVGAVGRGPVEVDVDEEEGLVGAEVAGGGEGVIVVRIDVTIVVTERLGPRVTIVVGMEETMGEGVGVALFPAEPEACEAPDEAGWAADEDDVPAGDGELGGDCVFWTRKQLNVCERSN